MSRQSTDADVELLVQKLQSFTSGANIHERSGLCGELRMCVLNGYTIESPKFKSAIAHAKAVVIQLERGDALDRFVKYRCSACGAIENISFSSNRMVVAGEECSAIISSMGWISINGKVLCPKCSATKESET